MAERAELCPTGWPAGVPLTTPGGKTALSRVGDAYISQAGHRYPVERGILRMLADIDADLARELAAQHAAGEQIYLNPRLLQPRHEETVARVAVPMLLDALAPLDARPPRLLDAGCGVGLLGRMFPGLRLVGLDASFPLLERAETGYERLIEGTVEALPFPDASFDGVIAFNMLHHVIRPQRAMTEFARILRSGGVIVAVDPRRVAPIELVKQMVRGRHPAYAASHTAFRAGEYEALLTAGGAFSIEKSFRSGSVGLAAMGGLDATGLSALLPRPDLWVQGFESVDHLLARLPGMERAGLDLFIVARRSMDRGR